MYSSDPKIGFPFLALFGVFWCQWGHALGFPFVQPQTSLFSCYNLAQLFCRVYVLTFAPPNYWAKKKILFIDGDKSSLWVPCKADYCPWALGGLEQDGAVWRAGDVVWKTGWESWRDITWLFEGHLVLLVGQD